MRPSTKRWATAAVVVMLLWISTILLLLGVGHLVARWAQ
jgi:hypothetical protein